MLPEYYYQTDGRKVWVDQLNGNPQFRASLFSELRLIATADNPQIFCGCKPFDKAPPLSIVLGENRAPHLRRYPERGHEHEPECQHYLTQFSGRTKVLDRFEQSGDKVLVRLDTPLKKRVAATTAGQTDPNSKKKSKSRPGVGCYGLFDFLYEQCHLNRWFPRMEGKRGIGTLYAMQAKAMTIQAGKRVLGEHFQTVLTGLPNNHFFTARNRLHKIAKEAQADKRSIFVLGIMERRPEYAEAKQTDRIRLPLVGADAYGIIPVTNPAGVDVLCKNISTEKGRLIALLQGEPVYRKDGAFYLNIVDGVIRATTQSLLPVDSALELQVADLMVSQQRAFEKPLKFSPDEFSLPDFILLDSDPSPMIMEVFGFYGEKYIRKQVEKTREYNTSIGFGNWWAWYANKNESMPALPPRVANRYLPKIEETA